MNWPEDIARDLPNPHPEEPASLRSDILDELHDHLQSSLEHEQLTEADADAARKSVLSRFGNPATIACRLWWDAMWGRIMMQRITLVFVILLCLCSVIATAFVWQAVQSGQQVTAALLAEVKSLQEQVNDPEDERMKYLGWIPVTVKLVYENGDLVTDEKVVARLESIPSTGMHPPITHHPDEQGEIDFGFVKSGHASLSIEMPWKETYYESIYASPGSPVERTITCPRKQPEIIQARLKIDWPEDLREQGIWTWLSLNPAARELDGNSWQFYYQDRTQFILMDPEGRLYSTLSSTMISADQQDQLAFKPYPLETLEAFVNGTLDEELSSQNQFYTSNYLMMDSSDKIEQQLRKVIQGRLSDQRETATQTSNGASISQLVALKLIEKSDATATFKQLLPIGFQSAYLGNAEPPGISPDDWTYEPSDKIVELVRKRLEQIEAREKPREEVKRDAAGVSAYVERQR